MMMNRCHHKSIPSLSALEHDSSIVLRRTIDRAISNDDYSFAEVRRDQCSRGPISSLALIGYGMGLEARESCLVESLSISNFDDTKHDTNT